MARDDLRVKVRLTADTKQAQKSIGRATKSFSLLNKSFVAMAAGAAVVVFAFRGIVRATSSIIAASSKQIDAENTLTTALFKLGNQAKSVSAALQQQAAALELVTRFGDEETLVAQAQLAVFVQEETLLKRLTVATQDFATAQGISLVSAAQLIGKTLGSTTNALVRYGIVVEGAAGSTDRAVSAIESLADLFGGRALSDAKTFSGRIAQLGNAFGTLQERLGDSLTRNKEVTDSLREMRDVIADPKFVAGVDQIAKGIASFVSASVKAVASIPALFQRLGDLKTGFDALRNSGTLAGGAIDGLIDKLQKLQTVAALPRDAIFSLVKSFVELGRIRREEIQITEEIARNEQLLQVRRGNLTVATKASLPIFRAFAALQERINNAAKEGISREQAIGSRDAKSLEALTKATDAAGLSIKLLSEEIEKQQDVIEAVEAAFKRGAIGVERYEATLKAAKDRIAELNGTTQDTNLGLQELGGGFAIAGQGANRFGSDIDRLNGKLVQVSGTAQRFNVITRSGPGTSGQSALFNNLDSNGLGAFQTRSTERVS